MQENKKQKFIWNPWMTREDFDRDVADGHYTNHQIKVIDKWFREKSKNRTKSK